MCQSVWLSCWVRGSSIGFFKLSPYGRAAHPPHGLDTVIKCGLTAKTKERDEVLCRNCANFVGIERQKACPFGDIGFAESVWRWKNWLFTLVQISLGTVRVAARVARTAWKWRTIDIGY